MTKLTDLTAGVRAWFDALALPNITKKTYQPALEDIPGLPMGVLIVTWDKVRFENLAVPYNDQLTLTVQLDCMVKPGKALETVDALRQALTDDNHMGHLVLSTTVEEIELFNPSQGREGFTVTLQLAR